MESEDYIEKFVELHIGDGEGSSSSVHNITVVTPDGEEEWPEEDRLSFLLHALHSSSTNVSRKKTVAAELRELTDTRELRRLRILVRIPNSVTMLLAPLQTFDWRSRSANIDILRNISGTILNVSCSEANTYLVSEIQALIQVLDDTIMLSEDHDTEWKVSQTYFHLSKLESVKYFIGELEEFFMILFLGFVVDRIVATTNLARNKRILNVLLLVFEHLSTNEKCMNKFAKIVPVLLTIIKGDVNFSRKNKESCVIILYAMFVTDESKLKLLKNEANAIYQVANDVNSTDRSKRIAIRILEMLTSRSSDDK